MSEHVATQIAAHSPVYRVLHHMCIYTKLEEIAHQLSKTLNLHGELTVGEFYFLFFLFYKIAVF